MSTLTIREAVSINAVRALEIADANSFERHMQDSGLHQHMHLMSGREQNLMHSPKNHSNTEKMHWHLDQMNHHHEQHGVTRTNAVIRNRPEDHARTQMHSSAAHFHQLRASHYASNRSS